MKRAPAAARRHRTAITRIPRVVARTDARLEHAEVELAPSLDRRLTRAAREYGTGVEALVQAAWSILLDTLAGDGRLDETMSIRGLLSAGDGRPGVAVVRFGTAEFDARIRPERTPAPDAVARAFLQVRLTPAAALRLTCPAGAVAPGAADRLLDCLLRVLEAAVVAPDQPICRVEVLGDEDRRCVRGRRPDVPASGLTVIDLFEDQVDRAPGAVALTDGETALTYAELDDAANRLAHRLITREPDPPAPVVLDMPLSEGLVIGLLGALKAGAACLIGPGHLGGELPPEPFPAPGRGPDTPAPRPARSVRDTARTAFLTVPGPAHHDTGVTIHHGELLNLLLNDYLEQGSAAAAATRRPSAESLADLIATVFPPLITGAALVVPPDAVASQPRRWSS